VRGVVLLAALLLVGIASLSACGSGQGPDYNLTATANCLRAANYVVVHGYTGSLGHGGPRWLAISQRGGFQYLGVFFAPSAKAARHWAAATKSSDGTPVDRNVAFDIGGSMSDIPGAIRGCLRSG